MGLFVLLHKTKILCISKTSQLIFLQQVKALEWIQKNIQAFGGDPAKVIFSGFEIEI